MDQAAAAGRLRKHPLRLKIVEPQFFAGLAMDPFPVLSAAQVKECINTLHACYLRFFSGSKFQQRQNLLKITGKAELPRAAARKQANLGWGRWEGAVSKHLLLQLSFGMPDWHGFLDVFCGII